MELNVFGDMSMDAFESTWENAGESSATNNAHNKNITPSISTLSSLTFDNPNFESELATTVKFLASITTPEQYKLPELRDLRRVAISLSKIRERTMFDGMSEEEYRNMQFDRRSDKKREARSKDLQKKYINATKLRQGRIDKLNQLKDDAMEEEAMKMTLMIPDGAVDSQSTKMLKDDVETEGGAELQQKARSCYACKNRYYKLHSFYDQLCESCAPLNWSKRFQTADLHGRVAVVTGSRVKIGYQTCLKLLRAGCVVIATSRFPNAACLNYTKEVSERSERALWQKSDKLRAKLLSIHGYIHY